MILAPEPYPGYFNSDPFWDATICAELYTLVGEVHRNHFHPIGDGNTPVEPLGFGLGPFGEEPFGA